MKLPLLVLLGLALLIVEATFAQTFGLVAARVDVTVVMVVFLAMSVGTLEGAIASFGLGYLYDVMSGRPTGLFVFLAVLTFVISRLVSSLVDMGGAVRFGLVVMGAEFGHTLLASLFSWLTSEDGAVFGGSFAGVAWRVVLAGVAAVLLHPLLRKIDPGQERSAFGELR